MTELNRLNSTFNNGCRTFWKSTVVVHSNTDMHKKAVGLQRISETEHLSEIYTKPPSTATTIGDSIRSMGELTLEQRKNLEKLFHIVYFIGYMGVHIHIPRTS